MTSVDGKRVWLAPGSARRGGNRFCWISGVDRLLMWVAGDRDLRRSGRLWLGKPTGAR